MTIRPLGYHVSLEFRFGLDAKDAEINAVRK